MSAPARDEVDTTVWREVGAPLVAATATGPLTGHTVAVKDLFAVAGHARGAGVGDYLAERAPEPRHATVVAVLLAAGADVTGIATTDEFAYSITGGNGRTGMPVNPAVPQRVPGGSSSGPAVAVARGEASIGLGTDTAGSIRVPGAYQGLWGIRTTHGSLDTTGLLPLAPSFDTIGWLARDAATLAAVADAVYAARPAAADTGRLVVDPALCAAAPSSAEQCLWAARELGAVPVALGAELDRWFGAFRTVQAYEAWAAHGDWIVAHPGALEPEVADRFGWAATVTAEGAAAARNLLARASARITDVVGDGVLLLPTTAGPPPYRDADARTRDAARTATLRLTCLAAIAGLPAVTVPLPRRDGLPVGLCLLGAAHTDRALIGLAARCAPALTGSA
ncbi:amidase [Nocardia neocaledoniensis NBRC 108232]|uniref:Asp-tRNA(Asn)/Glu-tRNA(Gln) amidotransferase A subunit family amidase n=1 Tax=Nocardia neocaledoniensis TaxID=236511 RepID=A0A317P0W5_9NOCA|nr:amidase family protein [Nocardia neocaledoniensis]PWV81037.1 Asp-tRNA(Asn)/Glu-tRNA(Gln) amidotransferase A subunit family amidase [Nocardia neocaledoniensis]GEM32957.1 amidase [Nocardia neocaledoniensis NBRC 108232]